MKRFISYLETLQKQRKLTRTHIYIALFGVLLFLTLAISLPNYLLRQQEQGNAQVTGIPPTPALLPPPPGSLPTPTPTITIPTNTPIPTPTNTPIPTSIPTNTPTPIIPTITLFIPTPTPTPSKSKTWSHVQTKAQNSSARINSLSFSSSTRAGDTLIAEVDWSANQNFTSITDSQGNVFTQIGAEQNSTLFNTKSRLYYAKNIRGGTGTITTTLSGTPAYHELYIHEYSGLDLNNPLDNYAVKAGTGGSFSSNSLRTTRSNDLLYGVEIDSSTGNASSGWTSRSRLDSNVAADKNASNIGSYAFTGSSSGGGYIAWIAALRGR